MVSVRLITLMIVGFLLGAFAAGGVGVRVIREVRTSEDATSLPAQNIARADGYHVDPNETLISSVALVPTTATIGDEGLSISYDLVPLVPSLGVEPSEVGPLLYPKRWLAEAGGGEFEGVPEDPDATRVVFPLLAGGTIDQVESVRVVEAFVPAPFEVPVVVSTDLRRVSVMSGVDVELVGEMNNGDTTTIEVRIVTDSDVARDVYVVGSGPQWHPASVERDSVMLTRDNDDNGGGVAEFGLVVGGTSWVAIDGEYAVNLGAIGE